MQQTRTPTWAIFSRCGGTEFWIGRVLSTLYKPLRYALSHGSAENTMNSVPRGLKATGFRLLHVQPSGRT
jgi:hypothetical protein